MARTIESQPVLFDRGSPTSPPTTNYLDADSRLLSSSECLSGILEQLFPKDLPAPSILLILPEGEVVPFPADDGRVSVKSWVMDDATPELRWDPESFDVVVALDVIGSLIPEQRGAFIAECLRVSRAALLLSTPNELPAIQEAESLVRNLYRSRYSKPHPLFPSEEIDRLDPQVIVPLLREQEVPFVLVEDGPLEAWLAARLRRDHPLIHAPGLSQKPQVEGTADSAANPLARPSVGDVPAIPAPEIPYRSIFVVAKSFAVASRLHEVAPREYSKQTHLATVSRVLPGVLGERLQALDQTVTDLQRQGERLERAARAQDRVLSQLPWKQLARKRCYTVKRDDLVPAPSMHAVPGTTVPTWRATNEQAYFDAPCLLPRGWIVVKVRITRLDRHRPEQEVAQIHADFGEGFPKGLPLEKLFWSDLLQENEAFVYLPRPARRLRIEPLKGPATFTVEEFSARPIGALTAAGMAVKRKVQLALAYRCLHRVAVKGLWMLVTGRWLRLGRKLFGALPDSVRMRPDQENGPETHSAWWSVRALPDSVREHFRAATEAMENPPHITVVLCVDTTARLRLILESFRRQVYPHWKLLACVGAAGEGHRPLLERFALNEPRLQIVSADFPQDPAHAWQTVMACIDTDRVCFLNQGYQLSELALFELARRSIEEPEARVIANCRAPLPGEDPRIPAREVRLYRTDGVGGHLHLFRRADLTGTTLASEAKTPVPFAIQLYAQVMQPGVPASYMPEALTYTTHQVTQAHITEVEPTTIERLPKKRSAIAQGSWMVTGDIRGITGWDYLVYEVARGMKSLGMDVRFNAGSALSTELLPPEMLPMIRRRLTVDNELTICSPFFLHHHNPSPNQVIFTMWESDQLRPEWVTILNRARLVLVPSPWGVETLRANGVTVPIQIVPLGHDPLRFHPVGPFPEVCTFGAAAALWGGGVRKNVHRVIQAFQRAFPDETDVRLRVKITPKCQLPETDDPRIEILRVYLSPADLAEWYRSLTVFVNASAAEGFGLHLLEAMASGRAVLSSDYSGVSEYFDESIGYRIDHRIVPIEPNEIYDGNWSDPDDESMIQAMRAVYENPEEARRRGIQAAARARRYTWKHTGRKLIQALRTLEAPSSKEEVSRANG